MAHRSDGLAAQVLREAQALHANYSSGKPGWSKERVLRHKHDGSAFVALFMSLCMPGIRVYPIHDRKTLLSTSLCLEGMI